MDSRVTFDVHAIKRCNVVMNEISNFALPGYKCIHNLNYWDQGAFIGAGAGASSFINMIRSKNTEDIVRYKENLDIGMLPVGESTTIGLKESFKEFIFLGLRKTEGLPIAAAEKFGRKIAEDIPDEIRKNKDVIKAYLGAGKYGH